MVEAEGWTESWGLKRLAGAEEAEEEVGEESQVRFLEKTTWARGGWEEGAADRSNPESVPQEREREAGKAEVEVAEEGSTVGEWRCGGWGTRRAWQPGKEAKEAGRKGAGEAC